MHEADVNLLSLQFTNGAAMIKTLGTVSYVDKQLVCHVRADDIFKR